MEVMNSNFWAAFVVLCVALAGLASRRRPPYLREMGWGALLVPVTAACMWVFGGMFNLGGKDYLFGQLWWNARWAIALLMIAGLITALAPAAAGDLAALALLAMGLYGIFIALLSPPGSYGTGMYASLIDRTGQRIVAVPVALLFTTTGLWLAKRTIIADIRTARGLSGRARQLTETRTDAIDTSAAELRRVERDLRDGAQARLVAVGMNLRAAERLLKTNPDAALALVTESRQTSARALAELRDLVRGIHPPVLADRGLGDAVRALALDTPLMTVVEIALKGRPPMPVESAAYFAVAEILANVVKHAGASRALIRIEHTGDITGDVTGDITGGMLRIEVMDDGAGGANPDFGTGLRGVERRLGTFDGILAISSPPGGPTIVVIEVPCALSLPKTSSF
jgi:signal transduction histidine kinase